MSRTPVKLTAELIEAFAGVYLSPMYDNPQPVAQFHRESWDRYCTSVELSATAAPREHAKSTALTHVYALAVTMFRVQDYVVVVSATEQLAMDHLGDISAQLRENEELRRDFQVTKLLTDARGEIVVLFNDGHQCRFVAKGAGQKMRGLKWRGKRPGLILCDDLEEDEQVENKERREKFKRWFLRALIPCKRRGGLVRVQGTILHEDSLLAGIIKDPQWDSKLYKAHRGFDDFTEILWPEQFPEKRLRSIRQRFINQGDAPGYSQEYLNDPFDNSERYLRKEWFLPMTEEDFEKGKLKGVGVDFAISKADKANRTSFTVGGMCQENVMHVFDQRVGRMDSLEIVETFFEVHAFHRPDFWWVENGQIWLAIKPMLMKEMLKRNIFLNIIEFTPIKDKAARGRPLQKRMRSGGARFYKEADWYAAYEDELLRFTGISDAVLDDQFDSTALLAKGFEYLPEVDEEDLVDEDTWMEARMANDARGTGRNKVTGY